MRLATKLSLALILITLACGVITSVIVSSYMMKTLERERIDDVDIVVRSLAYQLADGVINQDKIEVSEILHGLLSPQQGLDFAYLRDKNGAIMAHTFKGKVPENLPIITPVGTGQDRFALFQYETSPYLISAYTLLTGGELGTVYVGINRSILIAEVRSVTILIMSISLAVAVLGGIAVSIVAIRVTRPLKQLTDSIVAYGSGALLLPAIAQGGAEIVHLSSAFHEMVASRNRAEAALRFQGALLEAENATILDGVLIVSPERKIVYHNQRFLDIWSVPPDWITRDEESLLASIVNQFADPETFLAKVLYLNEHPEETSLDDLYLADGRIIERYSSYIADSAGNGYGRIWFFRDITDKIRSRQELAAEKERLAVTLRSIGDGVITTDVTGKIVLLNKVAEELTGWSSEEAIGCPLAEVFSIINEQTREVCENPVNTVLATGQIVGLANHTALVARDGTERSIADSGAPILDAESRIIGVVLVFRDVTAQIRTERELIKVMKLESIGVLAGGIAHDFNNILAAIMGNINLALFDAELKDDTRTLLSQAEKASLRARDLTKQLLTFAKGGEPVKELSSLENVIRDSASFVLHGDKVVCRFSIQKDLWLADVDKGQISQVIQNIVINAKQAMPDGGVVSITCENLVAAGREILPFLRGERYIKIIIADRGIGMPANVTEKIFDPYYTTKQEGNGLGLAITHNIINKHNGQITVASTPGVGTTFTIYLPASATELASIRQAATTTATAGLSAKIMVMDDDEMVLDMAEAMLTSLGHQVVRAADGVEAIRLYRDALQSGVPINLVIMDLTIQGGMGGEEAVGELLYLDPTAKVIVSSGYATGPIMANYAKHGFKAAIVKPYQRQELEKAVAQIFDQTV